MICPNFLERDFRYSDVYITGNKISYPVSFTVKAMNTYKVWISKLFILYFEGKFIILGEL